MAILTRKLVWRIRRRTIGFGAATLPIIRVKRRVCAEADRKRKADSILGHG